MTSAVVEAIGWAGSLLLLWSMTRSNVRRLRQINLAACVTLTVYSTLVQVWPMAALNLGLCVINLAHLRPDVRPRVWRDPAARAADRLARLTGVDHHDVVLVLGSGWGEVADLLGTTIAEVPTTKLPGFPPSGVRGHAGTIRSIDSGGVRVLAFLGRTHLYEGLGVDAVAQAMRTAAAAGCTTAVLTNGSGSLQPSWPPGTAVVIKDHINLTGVSPLRGANFVDMSEVYSTRLRNVCRAADPDIPEGVYVQFPGPQYETPAEVQMARRVGGDLVGMSTTIEAIMARSLGLDVLGLSLVTNLAAGIGGQPLDHEEVLTAGRASVQRLGPLLTTVLGALATEREPASRSV